MSITEKLRGHLRVNLRAHRLAASLTLSAAAARAHIHVRHWQKIEAGQVNVSLQMLARLCVALNLTPTELLGEPPPKAPPDDRAAL